MTIEELLAGLNRTKFVVASLFFVGLVAPGFLVLYLFKPQLVTTLDTTKVLVFSIALTAPGVFVPFFVSWISSLVSKSLYQTNAAGLGAALDWYLVHTFNNSMSYYVALLVAYRFHFTFRTFLYIIAVWILLAVCYEMVRMAGLAKGRRDDGRISEPLLKDH